MPVNNLELRQAIRNKTDEELYDVLYTHPAEYPAEAIEFARMNFKLGNWLLPQ